MQVLEPSDQIKFLTNLQRLLAEGSFTATYKYALLSALAMLLLLAKFARTLCGG